MFDFIPSKNNLNSKTILKIRFILIFELIPKSKHGLEG